MWQEIFDNGLKIDPRTIVDVWKGEEWPEELARVTGKGFSAILSAPFYLNYLGNPYAADDSCNAPGFAEGDWCGYYLVEPLAFSGSDEQKARVLGGEGTMWAEFSSAGNVVQNTWPKAAALGERFWSDVSVRNVPEMAARLAHFTCELNRRGIAAGVVTGPGYCEWQ